ncbi:SOS-induced cell division inhibitor SulA [Biostraticola tofi]|uniref:Cell division inhibitor SulA n=1 Tax=Biostraticola tofi TaxID=466109 RepID=A0A4R3YZS3_9GAMM|nr:SOS-induced cell division inhibitor SulA [Biostraticola tofi]TCV98180.1 SOS cell division inhibitor SulA [Biostraticola tofi]
MRTQLQHPFSAEKPTAMDTASDHVHSGQGQGIISEVVYFDDQQAVGHILLPLLRQLGKQSRWLLWLTSSRKLSRLWLEQSGLPLGKVVQLRESPAFDTIASMEKALLTGNYSAVLGWFPQELTEEERVRLRDAAQRGGSFGFVMYPQKGFSRQSGQFPSLKIQSTLYH